MTCRGSLAHFFADCRARRPPKIRICPRGHARRHANCYRSHAPPFPRHCAAECRPYRVPHAASSPDGVKKLDRGQWAVGADAACGPQPPPLLQRCASGGGEDPADRAARHAEPPAPWGCGARGPAHRRTMDALPVCSPPCRPVRRDVPAGGTPCLGAWRRDAGRWTASRRLRGERGPTRGRPPLGTKMRAVPMPWGLGRRTSARPPPCLFQCGRPKDCARRRP